jgi:MFS family permease
MAAEQGLQELRAAQPEWYAADAALSPTQAQARQAAELRTRINAGKAAANVQMAQGVGAILGTLLAPLLGARWGRRPTYFLLCLCSLLVCGTTFRVVHHYSGAFLLWGLAMSFTTASFYGWFPLYLPELFPTKVRATGQGLSYNFGRLFAAVGALTQGQLVAVFDGSYARAGAVVTLIYLLGMAVIWLAPETKGKPLPE